MCSPITKLIVRAFCHWLSLGMKHGSITLNHRKKDSQSDGIIQLLRSLRLPVQQGKTWPLIFGMQKGDSGR
jgi:hypothetical protein